MATLKRKTADRSCCHCPIRRPRPVSGYVRLRAATWGDVCSPRTPDLFGLMKAGACTTHCLGKSFYEVLCLLISRPHLVIHGCHGPAWDANGFFGIRWEDLVFDASEKQDVEAFWHQLGRQLACYFQKNTTCGVFRVLPPPSPAPGNALKKIAPVTQKPWNRQGSADEMGWRHPVSAIFRPSRACDSPRAERRHVVQMVVSHLIPHHPAKTA